jgi:hypothetical protein
MKVDAGAMLLSSMVLHTPVKLSISRNTMNAVLQQQRQQQQQQQQQQQL